MGCGTSVNEAEVKEPNREYLSEHQIKELADSNGRFMSEHKVPDLKESKTEKSIILGNEAASLNKMEEEIEAVAAPATRIYLFGESANERKVIEFSTLPTPSIEILLSRSNVPSPHKYQPNEIILEESQELCSSYMYNSSSHPPYNYMFATFIRSNTIFLCGGVNYEFEHVANEAFLYSTKEVSSPSKIRKERSIGNNLMGTRFERLALMKESRYSHMGVFMKAGKLGYIYVMGGRSKSDQVLKSCEKYSLQENKWTQIAPMNYPRSTGFALIVNDKIYTFGGYTSDTKRSKKIERYNPAFDSWEVLNFQLHRGVETGLLLPCPQKNDILIVGGNVEFGSLKSVIRINFETETYGWDSDMKHERLLQKGIPLLEENTAYVFGGDFNDTIERYSYKDKTWKTVTNLSYSSCVSPDEINAFTMAQETLRLSFESHGQAEAHNEVCPEARYIFGTDDYPCIFELNTAKWVLKKRSVPLSLRLRSHMTAVTIKQGKIFIAGGIDSYYEKASRAAYIYYPGNNKAIEIPKMKEKKFDFAACVCGNAVYIFGGRSTKDGDSLSSCEKYDIEEGKWVQLSDMPRERAQAKAICTPDQKRILLLGGSSFMQTISEIDMQKIDLFRLDTETGTFWTLKSILPLPLEVRAAFIEVSTRRLEPPKKLKTEEEFEFLEDNASLPVADIRSKEEKTQQERKVENSATGAQITEKEENADEGQKAPEPNVEIYDLLVFNYNSYLKSYSAVPLTAQVSDHQQVVEGKAPTKLPAFNLHFEGSVDGKRMFYLMSNKGVFKWSGGEAEAGSQIVINQVHILQMPLERFCLA